MERPTGRWFFVGWCALAAVGVSVPPAEAGKIVRCSDAEGKVYFTDVDCPGTHSNEGVVGDTGTSGYYDPQESYGAPRFAGQGHSVMEQAARMEARKERVKERQAAEHARSTATQGPGYWDEVAARNAMISIENERSMPNRHYKPRNAAEMAIEYNARSVAGGGRHQVRVPDVNETHVYTGPALTHQQARQKALETTGYRSYGNLTRSQRATVDAEMAKYNHLPRQPSETVQTITPQQLLLRSI